MNVTTALEALKKYSGNQIDTAQLRNMLSDSTAIEQAMFFVDHLEDDGWVLDMFRRFGVTSATLHNMGTGEEAQELDDDTTTAIFKAAVKAMELDVELRKVA